MLVAILTLVTGVSASTQVTATISGRVEDGTGAAVAGASVTVRSLETGSTRVVATDDTGRITQFQEKPARSEAITTRINAGTYVFEPQVVDYIPSGRAFDIGGELFPALVAAGAQARLMQASRLANQSGGTGHG